MGSLKNVLRAIRNTVGLALDPLRMRQKRLRRDPHAPINEKVAYDALERPNYAYGVLRAAEQAKALGINHISAIEFGCAGGNGLLALEHIAEEVTRATGVNVDVYGFDIGEGLPKPLDYRDLPYAWKSEQFKMDIPKLKSRLRFARLVIGDVKDTVTEFCRRDDIAPIGFISFDLDYYTSTIAAFEIFGCRNRYLLPRLYCYFDDCIGPDNELHSRFTGELLAIDEFNEREEMKKIAPINGLSHKRIIPAVWNDSMYVAHIFEHPLYCQYIDPQVDMELALE